MDGRKNIVSTQYSWIIYCLAILGLDFKLLLKIKAKPNCYFIMHKAIQVS